MGLDAYIERSRQSVLSPARELTPLRQSHTGQRIAQPRKGEPRLPLVEIHDPRAGFERPDDEREHLFRLHDPARA